MTLDPAQDVRSRKRDRTRAEILVAAWDLARSGGIATLSLRELASRVGMRAPSLYTYFGSKNDLYDAMFADGMQQFADALSRSRTGRTPQETFRNRARAFVRAGVDDPLRFQLLFGRAVPGFEPSAHALQIGLTGLATTRQLAEEAGLRGQRGFDLFMATTHGLVLLQIANEPGGTRWAGLVNDAVDMLLDHYSATERTSERRRR